MDNRPYGSVAELSKAGLPASTIDRIRTMVRATPPRSARASESGSGDEGPYQAPPSRGMEPPESPVPAPRATTGSRAAWQSFGSATGMLAAGLVWATAGDAMASQ